MPAPRNTAQFVLTADPDKLNRTAKRLADHLLSTNPTVHTDALFMFNEFACRRLRRATVELLVHRWLKAKPAARDWHATVLRRLGQDVIDFIHGQLTRRRLSPDAAALIELLLTICPADNHEAHLMWEVAGHPQANATVRRLAAVAQRACSSEPHTTTNGDGMTRQGTNGAGPHPIHFAASRDAKQ